MDPQVEAARWADGLRAVGSPERAAQEKAYLKSDLAFLGVSVWQIRRVVKAALDGLPAIDHDGLVELVRALWAAPVHERRMAAVAALELRPGLLGPPDLDLLGRLIRESRTWALVDGLAADVVGGISLRHPVEVRPTLDRWARDPDFWVRRASLLAELRPLRDGRPLDEFLARADPMLEEREFFIRKAIGWVLREAARRQPDAVEAWLAARLDRVSGLTLREAVRHLPAGRGSRLVDQRAAAVARSRRARALGRD